MSLSSLNSIGQSVFELESGNENVDGQTDVGHINLIRKGHATRLKKHIMNEDNNITCEARVLYC